MDSSNAALKSIADSCPKLREMILEVDGEGFEEIFCQRLTLLDTGHALSPDWIGGIEAIIEKDLHNDCTGQAARITG